LGRPATAIPAATARDGPRRAAALLLLLFLLLASLAGALSDTSKGTSSLRGGATSVVLSVAATLVGLLVVVFGAAVLYAAATKRRGSPGIDGARRSTFRRSVVVALLLPVIAGIILLLHRHHPGKQPAGILPSPLRLPPAGSHRSIVHFVPSASFATLGFVALGVAVVVLSSFLRARRGGKAWNLAGILHSRNEPSSLIGPRSPLARSLATVRVPDPEEETDPRRAVVAAYLAMTHAAADAGAERRGHETPAEFLRRLLATLGTSQEAACRLTALFETARYSSKPFAETLRFDAINALRTVQAELAAPEAGGSGPPARGVGGASTLGLSANGGRPGSPL